MTPERWKRVEKLFEAAIAIAPDERAAWLDEARAAEPELVSEVEALVEADARCRDGEFLTTAISGAVQSLVAEQISRRIGERVGAYRLIGELGHGGMGTVYLAERDDDQYQAKVAMKFVRGALASPDVLHRFRAERQILANLAHPGIARLFDAGTTEDGTPYLVMELVDGTPIDEHCESHGLDLRARVRLFRRVAAAVRHAHDAGVVHRDLKPSNILVAEDGTPKLVDFGIAKLLDPEPGSSKETTTLLRVTPTYASPEQLLGRRVGAESDVYSLGVVLFELLTGRVPFEWSGPGGSFRSLERSICEEEPPRPSSLPGGGPAIQRSEIEGDLDNIVRKALRKEPERRYASVSDFDEDLRRWMDAEPVAARPATLAYRAGKFWRRNRPGVAAAAAALLIASLAGALMFRTGRPAPDDLGAAAGDVATPGTTRLVIRPFESPGDVEDQRYLSAGITEELFGGLARIPQLTVIGGESAMRATAESLDARAVGAQLDAELVLEGSAERDGERVRVRARLVDAGTGAERWSNVYEHAVHDLFSLPEAVALAIAEELRFELSGGTRQRLRERPTARGDAYELYLRGRYEWSRRTESGIWSAIEAFRAAVAADPEFALAYAGLADAYRLLPAYGNVSGPEALRLSKTAARRAIALDDTLAEAHTALAASVLELDLDRATASREYRRALALNPREMTALRWYGLYLAAGGDFETGLRYVERARSMDPLSSVAIGSVGTVHYFARRPGDAIRAFEEALTLQPDWATGHAVLGRVHLLAGRDEEAVAALTRAVELSRGEANDRALLATAHAAAGREDEARSIARELAEQPRGFRPAAGLAAVHAALGEPDAAVEWLQIAVELRDTDVKYLKVDPRFDGLRGMPAFEKILTRLGLD